MTYVKSDPASRRFSWWRAIGPVLCVSGAVLISGCSTLEDVGESTADGISTAANAMNPFNWFGDGDDGKATAADQKQDAASAKSSQVSQNEPDKYPKLSTVPGRPKQATSTQAKRDRQALRDGLVSDTKNAQYSDRDLRAQQAAPPPAPAVAPQVSQPDAVRANERIAPPAAPVAAPVPTARVPQVAGGSTIPKIQPPQSPQASRQVRSAPQPSAQPAQPVPRAAPQPAPIVPGPPAAVVNVPPSQPRVGAPGQAVAPQVAARAPVQPAPRRVLKTVQVATIYFNNGSSSLSRADRQVVNQVAQIVRRTGGRVRVIGHSSVGGRMSDATQRETINYQTSLQRAKSVASELSRLGIPTNRIQVSAEGDRSPIYAESSATGAAGNRRTEIYLDYVEGT